MEMALAFCVFSGSIVS